MEKDVAWRMPVIKIIAAGKPSIQARFTILVRNGAKRCSIRIAST
jgi:hypothetical protein